MGAKAEQGSTRLRAEPLRKERRNINNNEVICMIS